MWNISTSVLRRCSPFVLLVLATACAPSDPFPTGSANSPQLTTAQVDAPPVTAVSPVPNSANGSESPSTKREVVEPIANHPPEPKAPRQVESAPPPKRPTQTAPSTTPTRFQPLVPTFQTAQRMAGFSNDGNYYLHLESSRDTGAGIPRSHLQVVDVAANLCLQNSCLETRYDESAAKLDLADAEQDLLKQTWKVRQELGLTPPKAGTELDILSRSQSADGTETLSLKLRDQDQPLRLRLRQKQVLTQGKGEDRAAMQLEVTYNGQRRSLDSLSNFRSQVLGYSIREVHLSPDGKRVAVLLTAIRPTFEGTLATTLVQGFEL